ncbi:hypothetical protein L9F63_002337, partial [Diploptera punctata]
AMLSSARRITYLSNVKFNRMMSCLLFFTIYFPPKQLFLLLDVTYMKWIFLTLHIHDYVYFLSHKYFLLIFTAGWN